MILNKHEFKEEITKEIRQYEQLNESVMATRLTHAKE